MKGAASNILREKIITEAIRFFLQKGFQNTTINDIIDSLKISKGAFYWHFNSKNHLLETVIKRFEETFIDKVIEAVNGTSGNFQTRFRYYHKYMTEFAYHNKELCVGFMTLSAELTGNGTELEQQVARIHKKHREFLKDLVIAGKKEHAVKPDMGADMAAHIIMAINNGLLLEWYMNQNTVDSKLLAKTYRDIVLTGILKGK